MNIRKIILSLLLITIFCPLIQTSYSQGYVSFKKSLIRDKFNDVFKSSDIYSQKQMMLYTDYAFHSKQYDFCIKFGKIASDLSPEGNYKDEFYTQSYLYWRVSRLYLETDGFKDINKSCNLYNKVYINFYHDINDLRKRCESRYDNSPVIQTQLKCIIFKLKEISNILPNSLYNYYCLKQREELIVFEYDKTH